MKKSSKKQQGIAATVSRPAKVVGLDLGDRYSHYCMVSSAGPATVWRLQPAVWQYLPAQFAGAVSAIHPGPLRPPIGAALLGTQIGCQWWQTGQETCHRCRGPQAGCGLAQHVAQPKEV